MHYWMCRIALLNVSKLFIICSAYYQYYYMQCLHYLLCILFNTIICSATVIVNIMQRIISKLFKIWSLYYNNSVLTNIINKKKSFVRRYLMLWQKYVKYLFQDNRTRRVLTYIGFYTIKKWSPYLSVWAIYVLIVLSNFWHT